MRPDELQVEVIGDGPPVLLVHGDVVGPSSTWRKQRVLAERWRLIIPSRPGFGESPALMRNDFEVEAGLFAELLGDSAHLVGHSYGGLIALLAAAERPDAVRSLTVSEPGLLRFAAANPIVAEMIADGKRLFGEGLGLESEAFLQLFRSGAGSAYTTPERLPDDLLRGVELLKAERPTWEAEVPLERLAGADFPALVLSGDHSPPFEAVCDALADALGAERAVIRGRGHTIPSTGDPYNDHLEAFLRRSQDRY